MINRFREKILDLIGAYDEDYVKGNIGKALSPKKLSRIKKASKKPQTIKISKKILPDRESDSEYEVENLMADIEEDIPKAKSYKVNKVFTTEERLIYRFRFLNYTEESYDLLRHALREKLDIPDKFVRFQEYLHLKNNRLYFKNLPILRNHEIQTLVRETYFNPELPYSPDKIYEHLSMQGANLSRSKIRLACQRIEEYSRRRELRKPKKIEANFFISHSNTCCCDMFWVNGFAFFNVAECFSGYIKTYYVNSTKAELIKSCMIDFIKEISSFGKTITRCICDQGVENQRLATIDGLTVMFTKKGQAMHLAEFYNSLVAKRINLYLDLDFDPSEVLELVLKGLNHRKRKRRNHFSPIELLNLNKQDQKRVAANIVYLTPQMHYNKKKIFKGSYVRILMLSRKDQRVRPMSYKGYKRKYSEEVYRVDRIKLVKGTLNVYKYIINKREYFRNELLVVPELVDKIIPEIKSKNASDPLYDDDDSSGLYIPSDIEDPSDE
ncbi:MAG: hypothetical protein CMJ75_07395 [Planctomycetaceae bacterium]|nr:hypothetical protein [Planctomycetaceae bacterium]